MNAIRPARDLPGRPSLRALIAVCRAQVASS
jgi:hypothetical protein